MSKKFLQVLYSPEEPHYPASLALNTSPKPEDDTISMAEPCQAKVLLQIFFFLPLSRSLIGGTVKPHFLTVLV